MIGHGINYLAFAIIFAWYGVGFACIHWYSSQRGLNRPSDKVMNAIFAMLGPFLFIMIIDDIAKKFGRR